MKPMINKSFVRNAENIVTSVSFNDLASGQGMLDVQGMQAVIDSGSAAVYVLSSSIITSNATTTGANATFDLDFDIPIKRTILLEGTGYIVVKYGETGGGAGGDTNIYLIIKLRKVHNGTETDIVTVYAPWTTGGSNRSVTKTMKMTVPKTYYNVNDTLRVTVEGYGGGGGTRQVTLWHDPQTAGDEFEIWLPSKVDV